MFKEAFSHAAIKLLSIFVSVKVHILTLTTLLLLFSKISESSWTNVVISVAVGRVGIELLGVLRGKDLTEFQK